jgi:hypothetical protein
MSKNLLILPERHNSFYRCTNLKFDRSDYDKYAILEKMGTLGCTYYGEYFVESTDYYDEPLRVMSIQQFLDVWMKDVEEPFTDWDEANIAFLKALNPNRQIMLLFC